MSVRIVKEGQPPHNCDLPKRFLWSKLKFNPLCKVGNIVECDICHRRWKWGWDYVNYDSVAGWCPIHEV